MSVISWYILSEHPNIAGPLTNTSLMGFCEMFCLPYCQLFLLLHRRNMARGLMMSQVGY